MEPNTLMDLGGGVGILGTILIGGLAGWIAEKLTGSDMGIFMNILVGIIGSFIGAFIANALGLRLGEIFEGWFWGNLLVAVFGAVILLVLFRLIRGRRTAWATDMVTVLDRTVRPRHPEKAHRPDTPLLRKPEWIRVKAPGSATYHETVKIVRDSRLVTVCEEASCPNIGECWSKKHATFMVMGETCTRGCRFCSVRTGDPHGLVDPREPENVARALGQLDLAYAGRSGDQQPQVRFRRRQRRQVGRLGQDRPRGRAAAQTQRKQVAPISSVLARPYAVLTTESRPPMSSVAPWLSGASLIGLDLWRNDEFHRETRGSGRLMSTW
jgi:uncharacterized membrane protein YeaQ/YmgE (transglycosylase-associated protein family)